MENNLTTSIKWVCPTNAVDRPKLWAIENWKKDEQPHYKPKRAQWGGIVGIKKNC